MKFIKQFATLIQFNNFTLNSTNTPNVSVIGDPKGVHELQYTQYIQPIHDYSLDYFTIEAIENIDNLRLFYNNDEDKSAMYYSLDGTTWSEMETPVQLSAGDKIMFKGAPKAIGGSEDQPIYINGDNYENENTVNGKFNVEGNIMSLIYGDNFIGKTSFPSGFSHEFGSLFLNQLNLINAGNLILPATTLSEDCYSWMFYNCTSLVTAPELPATTLANYCYAGMFTNCTSLVTAPELPATTLADYCYQNMFAGCTSLTTAPELPAPTLIYYCYQMMFYGCTSLNYIKCLAINSISMPQLYDWVNGVASSGTFVKDSRASLDSIYSFDRGTSGIPIGWTVLDA